MVTASKGMAWYLHFPFFPPLSLTLFYLSLSALLRVSLIPGEGQVTVGKGGHGFWTYFLLSPSILLSLSLYLTLSAPLSYSLCPYI